MKKLLPILLSAIAVFSHSGFAQNATTTPVGAMTYTFPATSTPKTTYHSFPLNPDPIFTGQPSSVSSSTLTFSNVSWTPTEFASTPASYIVRVLSGQQAGRVLQITANSANSVTLSLTDRSSQTTNLDVAGFAVTTSDRIEILPCDTLASMFGDGTVQNPLVFAGGTSVLTADTISIFNRTSGKWDVYFYSTAAGQNCWRNVSSASSRNSWPVFPDDSVSIVRRSNRPATSLVLTGRVPTVAPLLKANPNASYATTLGIPVDVTLANVVLSGAWTKGTSVLTADTISLLDSASGKFYNYYQNSNDSGWRLNTLQNNVSSTLVPAGSVLFVRERASNLSGAASFNSFPLPYSL